MAEPAAKSRCLIAMGEGACRRRVEVVLCETSGI